MNVGIFYAKEREDEVSDIKNYFKEKDIKYSLFKIGKNWENVNGDELLFHLSNITHGVLIPFKEGLASRWFSFLVGYFQGKGIQGCIYSPKNINLPKYVKFPSISDSEELLMFLEDELKIWQENAIVDEARKNLLNLGISITVENLFDCIDKADIHSVKNFLKVGFSVNELSDKGTPLLVHAIRKRQLDIATYLIESKSNVNLLSKDRSSSALMEACSYSMFDIAQLLLQSGADPNLKNATGQTALMISLNNQNTDMIKLLVSYNADPTIEDNMGMDTISYASLFGMDDIVELLNGVGK